MQDRFKFRYIYNNKLYDVLAIDFSRSRGEIVSADKSETLMCKIGLKNLMQCTGLKDKNGKLIYEGDIVNLKNTRLDFEETHVVIFKNCAFQFSLPNSMQIDRPLYCWAINYLNHYKHIELEVIGNIYENPELLEDKWQQTTRE